MRNFLKKEISFFFNHNNMVVFLVLIIVSLIPIIKTYGNLNIGHDTFIPPLPTFSYKMGYQWNEVNNGIYLSNNYFIWISIFYILTSFGLSIYQSAFVYQFLIFFFSSLGVYKIYNLFNRGSKLFGLVAGIFIILSPHYLDHLIYYLGTVGIIWVCYFIFKFIELHKFSAKDILGIIVSFSLITDLPNPKYHFLLLIVCFFSLLLASIVNLIPKRKIAENSIHIVFILLGTLYLTLPFLFYGYSFLQNSGVKIFVKQGYKESGAALDYGFALINKMIRLFHTPGLNPKDGLLILTPLFSFMFYAIPIVVLGIFPIVFRFLDSKTKKIYTVFYLLALLLLFISKGSNPPFGYIYEYMLSNIKSFAFMRTTAGAVIFAAIFYALIYARIFQFTAELNFRKAKIFFCLLLLVIPIFTGYHMWSGHYFLNKSTINVNLNKEKYGIKIPEDYFKVSTFIKNIDLDTKLDIYPYALGYQYNEWGYYGYNLFPWLIDKSMISFDKRTKEGKILSRTNSLYIYHDKTLGDNYSPKLFFHKPESLVYLTPKIDIYRKNEKDFLPHFYTSFIDEDKNVLEFKKINPTKYRVVVHNATTQFKLFFTENFHPLWKIYPKQYIPDQDLKSMTTQLDTYYKEPVFEEYYRADKNDLVQYIQKRQLTSLGDMNEKKKVFYEYAHEKIVSKKSEVYTIDFVSKNVMGTIQNNNLVDGVFYETWFTPELKQSHQIANGYANSWILNPKIICSSHGDCIKNEDGSYDFEIIVEFWPQKLAYMSYLVSGSIIVLLILFNIIQSSYSVSIGKSRKNN